MKNLIVIFLVFIAGFFFLPSLFSTDAQNNTCPSLPTNSGTVTLIVSLSSTGTYRIWSRIMAADTTNNSYWLQIDNQCAVNSGDSTISPNVWTWVDYINSNTATKLSFSLTAGSHVIKLVGRESGVKVDRLIFTTDLACVPMGTGNGCATAATATPLPPTPKPTNTAISTPTFIPNSTKLSITLLLHGIGKGGDNVNPTGQGNLNPVHPQRTISVEIYNTQNQLVSAKTALVNYDRSEKVFEGVFDLGASTIPGAHTVKIKVDKYLRALVPGIQTITAGAINQLPQTTLISGDINADNALNIFDFNVLMGCYSDLLPAINCATANKTLTDLNDDGKVNQLDYNLFLRELQNVVGR